jgi:molybdopterin synthase catalytic subunit
MIRVLVTDAAIDVAAELDSLERAGGGAVATFTGLVRDDNGVEELFLEHYPDATEKALRDLAAEGDGHPSRRRDETGRTHRLCRHRGGPSRRGVGGVRLFD